MRKLISLEDNLVPTKVAYKEAFVGIGKYMLIVGALYCTISFATGFIRSLRKDR